MDKISETILEYASKMGAPGLGLAFVAALAALRFAPAKVEKADPIAAITEDVRELSEAVIELRIAISTIKELSGEVVNLRVTVARLQGILDK